MQPCKAETDRWNGAGCGRDAGAWWEQRPAEHHCCVRGQDPGESRIPAPPQCGPPVPTATSWVQPLPPYCSGAWPGCPVAVPASPAPVSWAKSRGSSWLGMLCAALMQLLETVLGRPAGFPELVTPGLPLCCRVWEHLWLLRSPKPSSAGSAPFLVVVFLSRAEDFGGLKAHQGRVRTGCLLPVLSLRLHPASLQPLRLQEEGCEAACT